MAILEPSFACASFRDLRCDSVVERLRARCYLKPAVISDRVIVECSGVNSTDSILPRTESTSFALKALAKSTVMCVSMTSHRDAPPGPEKTISTLEVGTAI